MNIWHVTIKVSKTFGTNTEYFKKFKKMLNNLISIELAKILHLLINIHGVMWCDGCKDACIAIWKFIFHRSCSDFFAINKYFCSFVVMVLDLWLFGIKHDTLATLFCMYYTMNVCFTKEICYKNVRQWSFNVHKL
jgi:hypothetical protein